MTHYVKTAAPCIDCGEPTNKRQPKSRAPLCVVCGINRACATMVANRKRSLRRIDRDRRAGNRAKRGA